MVIIHVNLLHFFFVMNSDIHSRINISVQFLPLFGRGFFLPSAPAPAPAPVTEPPAQSYHFGSKHETI